VVPDEEEDVRYWMGVMGSSEPWQDMSRTGVDRRLLEALQQKVILPGGQKAAAMVCLWRAAGFEGGGALMAGELPLLPGFKVPRWEVLAQQQQQQGESGRSPRGLQGSKLGVQQGSGTQVR